MSAVVPGNIRSSVRGTRGTAIAALLALAASSPALAATHTVTIVGMLFEPATVHAAPGDRVVWLNRDIVPHTATAADRTFDSGRIDPGQQWSLVVGAAGAIDYGCAYHPTMQGRLEVQ